jgi:phage tail sheath protein FI
MLGAAVPEYLAPGVSVGEPVAGPIEAVSTATTAFIARATGIRGGARLLADAGEAAAYASGRTILASVLRLYFANGGRSAWIAPIARIDAVSVAQVLAELACPTDPALIAVPEAAELTGNAYSAVARVLLDAAARARRFAVIDAPLGADANALLQIRASLDSSFGALYWPALRAMDDAPIPASGAVCGAYARSDRERGAYRSPGNLELHDIVAASTRASAHELAELDAAGVNVIRELPGMGIRLWGARTLTSTGELRYIGVRRQLLLLQNSISHGTLWAVNERNDARLWLALRTRIAEFLRWQFLDGALQGTDVAEAFYVRCDESTTSMDDRTAGIVVCEIGVALMRPAEFTIFRVAQRTASG